MLTVLYPYYNQPKMYALHVDLWLSYPKELRDQLKFIVIDDGSDRPIPDSIRIHATGKGLNLRVYRIKDQIPWNTSGARNLGFQSADTSWILSMDMDHDVPADQMAAMLRLNLTDPKWIHRFHRREFDGRDCREVHANCLLIRRDAYWAAGGHDEAYRNSYGFEDCAFRHVLAFMGFRMFDHDEIYIRGRPDVSDAITPGLPRDTKRNGARFAKLAVQSKEHILKYKATLTPLQFEWEEMT